ncbi:hypothetical protein QCA50_011078 [Cerrena zonata]|uniref:Lid2 complex component snt2 n=1 Tax=Cerrena zonata TaxID=2478898 RepID=A0AAW0FW48_9APHY
MPAPTSPPLVTLRNGDQVKVNDHVYCSPAWSVRDGTPYSIARIMEFLPAQGTPTLDSNGKRNEPFTRVRLAWYYRPSDVSDRPVADSRLLLAAIYSEVCDLNQLRARCHVIHRDKISDLAGWKKRPDRFYFTRLFDPWIRKEFEVIQASSLRNLPEHIRDVLVSRYEYVVAEKEIVPDLTDEVRLCATCEKWCPPPETVQCDRCKNFFHMGCVSPPLLAKPSRGYGWTCAPCSRQHEEEVDSHEVRHHTPVAPKPKSNAPAPRGRGRPRKDRVLAEKEENEEIKHFRMWPFRYFGQYTVAEDTLDPDDFIFPRAATRVGPKYQVNTFPIAGAENQYPAGEEERGSEATIEVLSLVNEMSPEELAAMETYKSTLTRSERLKHNVDWVSEAIHRFSNAWLTRRDMATVNMQNASCLEKWKTDPSRYIDRDWTEIEKAAFEDAILTHGAELRPVRDEVKSRKMPEVVRYYGHWKNMKLGEENRRIKAARASGLSLPDRPPSRAASVDDEASIIAEPTKANSSCGACRTRESEVWWKAPKGLVTNVLCDNCGISWRKYADLNVRPFREETISKTGKSADKREGTPLAGPAAKRARTSSNVHATPPSSTASQQNRCSACSKNGLPGKVLRCKNCSFKAHPGVMGATVDVTGVDNWLCDLCSNAKTQEYSVNYDCLLCPRTRKDPKKKHLNPPADSFLRSCKPTEGQAWVHSICSVFIPEINYSDATRLRLVEGISTIPPYRWMNKCTLCDQSGGAVVRCSDCPAEYHVSCAWKAGHKFGFEMQAVKASRRETTTIVDFRDFNGHMVPTVTCKGHPAHRRERFEMCEMNELGETALQVYCKNYKQAPLDNTHGLLRKAKRLDQIIQTEEDSVDSESTLASSDMHCWSCGTEYSPCFYSFTVKEFMVGDEFGEAWECHNCHMKQLQAPSSSSSSRNHVEGMNGNGSAIAVS